MDHNTEPNRPRPKTGWWAVAIGVVCGAELVVAAVLGGAGLALFLRQETVVVGAVLVAVLGGVLFAVRARRSGHGLEPGAAGPLRSGAAVGRHPVDT